MDTDRASQFIKKAEKLLGWIEDTIAKLEASGKVSDADSVEREFFVLLGFYESLYQAIVDSAKKLNLHNIREQINADRENDGLLRYFRFARNSEVHDAVLKWTPSMRHLEVRVIDAAKINRISGRASDPNKLFCYLYGTNSQEELIRIMKEKPIPDRERCEKAGVSIVLNLDCLSLKSFQVGQGRKRFTVKKPTSHLGKLIPPSAWICAKEALNYYKGKLKEVSTEINNQ